MSQPRLASTIIIIASNQWTGKHIANVLPPCKSNYRIFMVQRNNKTRFMKNNYVFPGGAQDPIDRNEFWNPLKNQNVHSISDLELAARICCIRELFEETGMALVKKMNDNVEINKTQMKHWRAKVHKDGEQFLDFCKETRCVPDIHALIPWSHWITPAEEKIRFDTRFYLTIINDNDEEHLHSHDGMELVNSKWFAPELILEAFAKTELLLPPPTWFLLRELSKIDDWKQLSSQRRDLNPTQPTIIKEVKAAEQIEGGMAPMIIALPGDPLHFSSKGSENHYRRILITSPFSYSFISSPVSKL